MDATGGVGGRLLTADGDVKRLDRMLPTPVAPQPNEGMYPAAPPSSSELSSDASSVLYKLEKYGLLVPFPPPERGANDMPPSIGVGARRSWAPSREE